MLCLSKIVQAVELINLDTQYLDTIEKKYGLNAKKRLVSWQNFIKSTQAKNLSEKEKLKAVNNFFNIYQFISDMAHWNQEDYWSTPLEFIVSGGGDCEDFTIAKYFTLIALNVPESKLLHTYVKAITLNQAHMVLAYYETPESMPLILDNLIGEIKPANERTDLVPVYSFNGAGVWLTNNPTNSPTNSPQGNGTKTSVLGRKLGKSTDMNRWSDLIQRINNGTIAPFNSLP